MPTSPVFWTWLLEHVLNSSAGQPRSHNTAKAAKKEKTRSFAAWLMLALAAGAPKTAPPPTRAAGRTPGGRTETASTRVKPPGGPPAWVKELAVKAAAKYGVNPSLVLAVIRAESGFDPHATSPAGAAGLMQLMPETAASLGVSDPYDPVQNVDGGVRYLKAMLDRYGGNEALALAAYNAGPGAVDRAGGIPAYRETRQYVQKVLQSKTDFLV